MRFLVAIVLTLLASSPSFAQATRIDDASSSGLPPTLLSCQSIELYDRFAGDFQKALKADSFGEGKDCTLLVDNPFTNLAHVEKSEAGYLCVRMANEPRCYWTDGSKLRNIGHGPQLSDEQFTEVERLLAEAGRLRKIANGYSERARQLDRSQQRQVDELNDLFGKATRQAGELQEQALKIGH
jgi:hypothetical protein